MEANSIGSPRRGFAWTKERFSIASARQAEVRELASLNPPNAEWELASHSYFRCTRI
jgi:hypothetical protein